MLALNFACFFVLFGSVAALDIYISPNATSNIQNGSYEFPYRSILETSMALVSYNCSAYPNCPLNFYLFPGLFNESSWFCAIGANFLITITAIVPQQSFLQFACTGFGYDPYSLTFTNSVTFDGVVFLPPPTGIGFMVCAGPQELKFRNSVATGAYAFFFSALADCYRIPVFENFTFTDMATTSPVALVTQQSALSVLFDRCVIRNITGLFLASDAGSVTLRDTLVTAFSSGRLLSVYVRSTVVLFFNTTFRGNTNAEPLIRNDGAIVEILQCRFEANNPIAALILNHGFLDIELSEFADNVAAQTILQVQGGDTFVIASSFRRNVATSVGVDTIAPCALLNAGNVTIMEVLFFLIFIYFIYFYFHSLSFVTIFLMTLT
jgi:hypothetical protein